VNFAGVAAERQCARRRFWGAAARMRDDARALFAAGLIEREPFPELGRGLAASGFRVGALRDQFVRALLEPALPESLLRLAGEGRTLLWPVRFL
jgi:hypothetical protein